MPFILETELTEVIDDIARYYASKLETYGATPKGVDWNGVEGQLIRFEQVCKVIDGSSPFTLNDVGCGYGALVDFLAARYSEFSYLGVDVAESMVDSARKLHSGEPRAVFRCGTQPDRCADYSVASGIFNVKLSHDEKEWSRHVESTLEIINDLSLRGFAFNCLTKYSDPERMRADLFYADPCWLFDLCKRKFSRNVAVLHDYDLYEFTLVVRK